MASLEGLISLGPWGGLGGDHWSYRASGGITEIVLRIEIQWPSEYLKSISGTYGSYKGLLVITSLSFITNLTTYGPFGTATGETFSIPIADSAVVGFHGRSGHYLDALGIFVIPIEIDGLSEHLTSITGTYGVYVGMEHMLITSLAFQTNLTTYGPFGTATGTSFSIPIEGSVMIGFHGRGGYYLDAIGIHVKPRDIEGTISIGPWGGPGGNPWSYMTNRGINQIVINVGSNIKSISFRDTTGLDSATFGGHDPNDIGERKTVSIPPCGVLRFLLTGLLNT
ncbi:Mannose/glucose-specific lectin [Salix suchowensis]|nr:Mannose/glucose-specific lectin [Salix suchowensis]